MQSDGTEAAVERLQAEIVGLEARLAAAKTESVSDAKEAAREAEAAQVARILRRLQGDISMYETNYISYLKL